MAIERWTTDQLTPGDREFIEVEDSGAAGDELSIAHNLGRVPRGAEIVNIVCSSSGPSGPVHWYRLATDTAWTNRQIYVRFPEANTRAMLEVF